MFLSVIIFFKVNTAEDEHSKMATDFSPNEITFFKKVVEYNKPVFFIIRA